MKPLDSATAHAQAAALAPGTYHDFAGLQGLKGHARDGGQGEAALRAAAQQFESMFLQEMLRTMRQATIKGDLIESNALDTFEGMFDKEVSMQMAKRGGMGLADMMVQQMKRHLPAEAAAAPLSAESNASSAEQAEPSETRVPSTQDVLQGRAAAGLPLLRPAVPHELKPQREQPGLPLAGPREFPLPGGPQGMPLKRRDLIE